MCGIACSITTTAIGVCLAVGMAIIGYAAIPEIITLVVIGQTTLIEGTEQMDRFLEIPFPTNFSVNLFTVLNPEEIENGGVPIVKEVGPYVYKLKFTRVIEEIDDDTISYRILEVMEFDAEASYPLTEDDMVTMINVPYHAVLQVAEMIAPTLMFILDQLLPNVLGEYIRPTATFRVGDFIFDGITLCENPSLLGNVVCAIVREIAENTDQLNEQPDGSLIFSLLAYKNATLSRVYKVDRGLSDASKLGKIITWDSMEKLNVWMGNEVAADGTLDSYSLCNHINGSDSGIFPPFLDRTKDIYAYNTDICRSLSMRYQYDSVYEGIPVVRYEAGSWVLDNHEGCFCLNVTKGITRENGCLKEGALEMYTCVGAFMVLTYPHFLMAHPDYQNGVIGLQPNYTKHAIFVEMEPTTSTPVRAAKRAQFNLFIRPVNGISSSLPLRTVLVPLVWIDEFIVVPDEYLDMVRNMLVLPLRILDIFIPVMIALGALITIIGGGYWYKNKRKTMQNVKETPETPNVVNGTETPNVVNGTETPNVVNGTETPNVVNGTETPNVVNGTETPNVVNGTETPNVVNGNTKEAK